MEAGAQGRGMRAAVLLGAALAPWGAKAGPQNPIPAMSRVLSPSDSPLPDAGREGADAVIRWSEALVKEGENSFRRAGLNRYPSPPFWGGEVLYQILVDRFNDGDPRNNFALVSDRQARGPSEGYRGIAEYHHGGDLKGVTQRLDYLRDLGITAIWLSPILLNGGGDYHGYCTSDFTQVDPNYGTKEDLRDLVKAAHERGIRVILDIVINHMCDARTSYSDPHGSVAHRRCADDLASQDRYSYPSQSPEQRDFHFSDGFFPPFKSANFFNRCGANSQAEMESDDPTSVFGDFTSQMLDFDTRNYHFQRSFANILKYWLAYADLDGFRLDAVKHVTTDFSAYLATTIRAYGQSLGKGHVYMVGEIAAPPSTIAAHLGRMDLEHNTKSLWDRLTKPLEEIGGVSLRDLARSVREFPDPGVSGVYDFSHSGIARDVLSLQRPSAALDDYFNHDSYYRILQNQGDPRLNLTILEIHDWPRFNLDFPHDVARSKLALGYLATAPGIPVIYYGGEQGFNASCRGSTVDAQVDQAPLLEACAVRRGPGRHPFDRQDMFVGGMFRLGSSVPQIDALAHVGPVSAPGPLSWEEDPFLDRSHDLYQEARRLLRLRQSCLALRFGSMRVRWSDRGSSGLFAFSREDYGREVLVVVNPSPLSLPLPNLQVSSPGVDFVNVRDPAVVARAIDGSRVDFSGWTLPPTSIAVWVPRSSLGPWSSSLGIHHCDDPKAMFQGSRPGRAPWRAAVAEPL